jgi:hypothetical protein
MNDLPKGSLPRSAQIVCPNENGGQELFVQHLHCDLNRSNARCGLHTTITRLKKGIKLSDAQSDKLDTNLQNLKGELQSLGESF